MADVRSCLVIVVDRWGAGFLGPYGNTWLETPALNRLASESLLCEQALADSLSLERIYRSYWSGRHAADDAERAVANGLASELAHAEIPAELITDEWLVADHPFAAGFDQKLYLPAGEVIEAAGDPAGTQFAALLAAAIERLRDPTPRLIWLHARGLAGPWDAPFQFRAQAREDEDPDPIEALGPPDFLVAPHTDPDQLLGWVQAYAGQVAAFDLCLGALFDTFRASPLHDSSLLVFTSPRGMPLGEHGRMGVCDEAFYEETVHVPLLVRRSDGVGALVREQALIQPADIHATLRDWFGLAEGGPNRVGRSLLPLAAGEDFDDRYPALATQVRQRALRTPAWFWREADDACELYVKPDDRWEVNEIASHCPEIVESLRALADAWQRYLASGGDLPRPDMEPLVWNPLS